MSDALEPKTYPGPPCRCEAELKGIAENLARMERGLLKIAIMVAEHDERILDKTGIKTVTADGIYSQKKAVKNI